MNRLLTADTEAKHADGEHRRRFLSIRLAAAEGKRNAVQTLLLGSRQGFQDAVPILFSAWRDLLCGIFHPDASSPDAERPLCNETSIFTQDGQLAQIFGKTIARSSWLERAASKYDCLDSVDVSRANIEVALDDLSNAIAKARVWQKRHRRGVVTRILHGSALFVVAVLCVTLTSVIGYGVYEYNTRSSDGFGLSATYFSGAHYTGFPFMWVDKQVDFNWPDHPPFKTNPRKVFSIRWDGCVYLEKPAQIIFETTESPYELMVDGKLIEHPEGPVDNANKRKPRGQQRGFGDSVRIQTKKPLRPGIHRIEIRFSAVRIPAIFRLQMLETGEIPIDVPTNLLVPVGGNQLFSCAADSFSNDMDSGRGGDRIREKKEHPQKRREKQVMQPPIALPNNRAHNGRTVTPPIHRGRRSQRKGSEK